MPPLGYALVGCGAFGRFCLDAHATNDAVRRVAVADANPDLARATARDFDLVALPLDDLLARPDVDVVHLATPPSTHRALAEQAFAAGKHVLCEKPLALTATDGEAMVNAARRAGRALACDLVMRYDPLCAAVQQLCDDRLLGEPLHAFFENYAKDEPLGPQHWFWDRAQSGGIFVEHAVHFFDLFAGWLGRCEPVSAQQTVRPGTDDLIESVQCACRMGDRGVLANFRHTFTQAARMDRQEMRLVFERGDVRLFEWLPTSVEVDALLTRADAERVKALFPDAQVQEVETYEGDQRKVTSRHKPYEVDGRFRIRADAGMDKSALYGHVLRELLRDQCRAIQNPAHARVVTEADALDALRAAERATELASEDRSLAVAARGVPR